MGLNEEIRERERRIESGVFPKRSVAIVRGKGCWLWDAQGRKYLDFGANFGVANVGHGHPRVLEAIREQLDRLVALPQTFANDARLEFMEKLLEVAPPGLDRIFLANSGTEAIEAAMKFARGFTGRRGFVAAQRAFHGRTLGALSLTFKKEYRAPFEPLLSDVIHVPFGDEEALKEVVGPSTAAVVLEPIQGEGGVHVPPPGYLKAAGEIAHDRGALLVLDEVQTGLGRTGAFWACEHEGVVPDILAFAKSVGGGLPLGGVLLSHRVATLPPSSHGNTFGGSPLSCKAGSAVLDVLREERLVENAQKMGALLGDLLRSLDSPLIREVRGRGLMMGVELKVRCAPLLQSLLEEGVLALPSSTHTVRFLPPLVLQREEVQEGVERFSRALSRTTPKEGTA